MTFLIRSIATLAFATLPLLAQPAGGRGPGSRAGHFMRALDLSETQKASIKAIHDRRQPEMATRREAVRQARVALQVAFRDPATSEAQLRSLHDKAAGLQFEMLLARRSIQQEVRAVLTPEQRNKAAELRADAEVRRQERLRRFRMAMGQAG